MRYGQIPTGRWINLSLDDGRNVAILRFSHGSQSATSTGSIRLGCQSESRGSVTALSDRDPLYACKIPVSRVKVRSGGAASEKSARSEKRSSSESWHSSATPVPGSLSRRRRRELLEARFFGKSDLRRDVSCRIRSHRGVHCSRAKENAR